MKPCSSAHCIYSCQSLPALAKLRPQVIRVLYSVTELPVRFEIWLQCRQNGAIIMSISPSGREQEKERDRKDVYALFLRPLQGMQIFCRHGIFGWPSTNRTICHQSKPWGILHPIMQCTQILLATNELEMNDIFFWILFQIRLPKSRIFLYKAVKNICIYFQ